MEQQVTLRRSLGLPHATAIVVGIIVGSSIFAQPSEITRLVPSPRWGMLVWAIAGLLTFSGALVCAELARAFPETGGVYIFLKRTFSPALAFLWGWAMFWSMHSGIIAAIAVILARYAGYFVPLGENAIRVVAIAVVLGLSFVNYLGVKTGGTLQVTLTAAKLAAIAAMVVLLFAFGAPAHSRVEAQAVLHTGVSFANVGLAIAAGLFAFGGWHMVTYTAGETRAPERTLPRALLIGTLIVTACYMLLNSAYQYVLTPSQVSQSTRVGVDAMQRVLGGRTAGAIAILVIVSALGSLNGIILAGPRVYFAMAEDGLAFSWMGAIHPDRHTPHLAIAAQAAISCVLIASNSYRELFTRVVYTEWIFFALLAIGLIRLRLGQKYKMQIAGTKVAIAAAFSITAIAVAMNQAAADLRNFAWGCGLILLGLPVYLVWTRRVGAPVFSRDTTPRQYRSR